MHILGHRDLTSHERHVDQVQFIVSGHSEDITSFVPPTNTGLDNGSRSETSKVSEESKITENLTFQRSERLRAMEK